ncbi:unnamed protein product [Urochloa humidicola]
MDDYTRRRQAEQAVTTAEQRLLAGDLKGCKSSAGEALSAYPGANALFAAADVLLAGERHSHPSDPADPYEVLGLRSDVPAARDPAYIESEYRRRSNLLKRPHANRMITYAFAAAARLVDEAWAFLSDPLRKAVLDSNLDAAAAAVAAAATAVAAAGRGEYLRICISTEPAPAPEPVAKRKNPEEATDQEPRRRRTEREAVQVDDGQPPDAEEDTVARRATRARRAKTNTYTTTTAT